ncbi:hypothetical protein ABG067_008459 [Albugo candida]
MINWRNEEFDTLAKLKESQAHIVSQMELVRGTHSKSADQIQLIFEALVLLQNQTEAVILKYNYLVQYHVGEMQNQLNQLATRQEYEVDYIVDAVVTNLRDIDRNIEDMIAIQKEAIENWSHSKVCSSKSIA